MEFLNVLCKNTVTYTYGQLVFKGYLWYDIESPEIQKIPALFHITQLDKKRYGFRS